MIIRWICEKCNKKWIYPIERCLYCKGGIVKQRGTKIKVVGFTKVNISSLLHPVVPYNILLLEDEFGNRLPKKTMKDYKIGDVYVEQKATTYDAVSVIKVKYDIYEALIDSINLINGVDLNSDDRVLVKPSIIAPAYPYQAVNTNPYFLDALLTILFEHRIKKENIIVAEQALIGSDVVDAASKAGILEICRKNGVKFVDISKGPFEEIESHGFTYHIFKESLRSKVINTPIMKTNFQLGISGALENISRLVDEDTQRRMYFNNVDETLPNLVDIIPNVITIADATNAMQAQGPLASGEPAFLNLILASKNAAALDIVFCEISMMQIPPHAINSIGTMKAKPIEVVGNEIDALKYPLKAPVPNDTLHCDIKVIDGKACPSCLKIMYNLTSKLVGLRGEQINLVMGSIITRDMLL